MDRAQHIANCIGSIQECERQLTVLAEQIQVTRDSATLASLHEKRLELLQHQDQCVPCAQPCLHQCDTSSHTNTSIKAASIARASTPQQK
eukprot:m.19545 g.19545  ORF g.19545 m.19545 type:complete len:90 (-) comp8048_c0_seq2:165-434(-)